MGTCNPTDENLLFGITADDEEMEDALVGTCNPTDIEVESGITADDEAMDDDFWTPPTMEQMPRSPQQYKCPPPTTLKPRHRRPLQPETDKQAVENLHQLAGDRWKTVNNQLYTFRDGLWTQDENAFFALLMHYSEILGKYGEEVPKMRNVMTLARTKNIVDDSWTQQLDQLALGLVPFANGIYDIATSTLRNYEPEDMITKRFAFNAPAGEDLSSEIEFVNSVLSDLLPEAKLRNEVMVRLSESMFNPSNTHKYFVQLYGEGNNGKTTLFRILQTAFPVWVQMPSVEHLVVKGTPRDPNSPQPWLVDVMGARILCFEEPSQNRPFDGALLKLLRGNGVVTGRQLHRNNVSYVPTYTLWIAANDLITIAPSDKAVLESLHPFKLPSYFSDGKAPLGTRFVKKKIQNLEAYFTGNSHKLALFAVLREYFAAYCNSGLPPLQSEFSKSVTDLYKDDHPGVRELLSRCFEEDKSSRRVREKDILRALTMEGCTETQKKMKLILQEQYQDHQFVRRYVHRGVYYWDGLSIKAEDDGWYTEQFTVVGNAVGTF